MKRANWNLRDVFIFKIENDFTKEFCNGFERYFKQHYTDLENIFYMKYFLSIIKEHLTSRFIFGHVCWCKRSTNLKNGCNFCRQVRRCFILDKSEEGPRSSHALYHYQRYDEHHERIFRDNAFFSKEMNFFHRKCDSFEHVYSNNQLIKLFAIISVRIFLNIGKNYFFVGRMKQGYMYNYFLYWIRKLYYSITRNISKQYCTNTILHLRPIRDYDPTYLKISNVCYIDYLEKEKCI